MKVKKTFIFSSEREYLARSEPMEQREQKASLLALCRVVTEEGEANIRYD